MQGYKNNNVNQHSTSRRGKLDKALLMREEENSIKYNSVGEAGELMCRRTNNRSQSWQRL